MSKHLSSGPSKADASKRARASSKEHNTAQIDASQNPFAVFTEWIGEADEKAYADL
jgi:pyridoxine/pyridoxamine 5'-phosphate oxidase